jgi:hypothetical protein
MQFLDFASDAESEYYSRISSGNYSVLKARNDYTRLEKIRFAESENVSEIFEELQIVSEMDCIEWQRTGELPIGFVPTLIGARGENNRYGFSLLKDGAGNGFGTISRLEMFPEESIEKNESPSIYEPFMIGKGGSIVQLVKLGHLKVEDWRYDSKSELWFGRFQVNESNQEWHVYFDPDRRWIRRTTLLIDQLPIFSKTLDYDDQNIRVIRVYRPNLSDPSDEGSSLLESWFFSSVRNERVDPNSLLISHYGHQEPFDDAPKNRLSYYWYLLPLFGIFLVLLARWIRRGSNVEY